MLSRVLGSVNLNTCQVPPRNPSRLDRGEPPVGHSSTPTMPTAPVSSVNEFCTKRRPSAAPPSSRASIPSAWSLSSEPSKAHRFRLWRRKYTIVAIRSRCVSPSEGLFVTLELALNIGHGNLLGVLTRSHDQISAVRRGADRAVDSGPAALLDTEGELTGH